MTVRRAALTTLIVALGLTAALATAAPALAVDDPLEPVITYEGGLTLTDGDGATYPLVARLTVDCTTAPCTALVTLLAGEFAESPSNGLALPLTDGVLSVGLPEFGDLCNLRWIGAGQLDVTITGDTATISRSSAPGGPVPCSDGGEATATAATIVGSVSVVSGSVCLVDDSCIPPKELPVGAGSPRTPSIAALVDWPEEPSVLTTLAPVPRALTGVDIAWIAGGGLVLALLVGFPSVLLDSATETLAGRIESRRERRGRPPRQPWDRPPLTLIGWPFAVIGLIVAAIASALVDPDFTLDANEARMTASLVISFVATVALGWAVVALLMLVVHPRSRPRVEFRPLTLLLVAGAVALSRLTGFEPGVVFGLLAGIGFGTALAVGPRGRASLIAVVYFFIAGGAAWWGYTLLSPRLGDNPSWLELLIVETLAGITVTAVSALPIALVPVRGLLGHTLWQWNRWVWALCYVVASAAFLLVLLPLPDSWQQIPGSVTAWLIAFAAYALAAVLLWLVIVQPGRREHAETPTPAATAPVEPA